jgi:hypothetical protein
MPFDCVPIPLRFRESHPTEPPKWIVRNQPPPLSGLCHRSPINMARLLYWLFSRVEPVQSRRDASRHQRLTRITEATHLDRLPFSLACSNRTNRSPPDTEHSNRKRGTEVQRPTRAGSGSGYPFSPPRSSSVARERFGVLIRARISSFEFPKKPAPVENANPIGLRGTLPVSSQPSLLCLPFAARSHNFEQNINLRRPGPKLHRTGR